MISEYIRENEGQVWAPDEFRKTLAEERDWVRGILASPSEILLLSETGGELVGNIDFHIGTRRRTAHAGELGMGILPEWRSRGVGSALLGRLIEWAEATPGIEKINLRALASNRRAIGLYEKHGFARESYRRSEFKVAAGELHRRDPHGKVRERPRAAHRRLHPLPRGPGLTGAPLFSIEPIDNGRGRK